MGADRTPLIETSRRGLVRGAGIAASAGLLAGLPLTALAAQANQGEQSAAAFAELLAALAEAERVGLSPAYGVTTEQDRAEGRRFLLHSLLASITFWLDADPDRPRWSRFVSSQQKLLGDNPDAIYFTAPVRPTGRYVIRGNIAGAAYTSFTVETGTADGGPSQKLAATLNDTQFDRGPDGSYEIHVGGPPRPRNWLALDPDAGSITTRHYYERPKPAAADPSLFIPLTIEPVEPIPAGMRPSDASIAAGIRRAIRFFRFVTLDRLPDPAKLPPYISRVPNIFARPQPLGSNRSTGFAAADNVYLASSFDLKADEALVMRGRFPRARFVNVVLWNQFTQTLDYGHRPVSLNRAQTKLEADGSFRITLAHRDPGTGNWLDTEGRQQGRIFWRFLLPEEPIAPIETEVITLRA